MAINLSSRSSALRAAEFAAKHRLVMARSNLRVPPLPIPPELAPISVAQLPAILKRPSKGTKDSEWARACRTVAFCAASANDDRVLSVVFGDRKPEFATPKGAGVKPETAGFLAAALLTSDDREARLIRMMREHSSTVNFDPEAMLTTINTTIEVVVEPGLVDINRLWSVLQLRSDPRQWHNVAPDFFQTSERLPDYDESADRKSWRGLLHERFEWNWNIDSVATVDNFLNINFEVKPDKIHCDYSLYKCNFSRLWVAREYGGLDADGGFYGATLYESENRIVIEANKAIRFTQPELGPDGLAAVFNYLAPTVTGLWMHKGLGGSTLQALRDAARPAPTALASTGLTKELRA